MEFYCRCCCRLLAVVLVLLAVHTTVFQFKAKNPNQNEFLVEAKVPQLEENTYTPIHKTVLYLGKHNLDNVCSNGHHITSWAMYLWILCKCLYNVCISRSTRELRKESVGRVILFYWILTAKNSSFRLQFINVIIIVTMIIMKVVVL